MKISIITVCFNSAATIEDTIKSVLSQDYSDIEYIVVDGKSTDPTLEILAKYRDRISRHISEPDSGIYDAMNKGINLASGSIIGFLNSDDIYANKEVISKVAQVMQTKDIDCCYGDLEYVAENNPNKIVRRWKSQPYHDSLFRKGWHPPHPTFFVKRSAYYTYGVFDLSYNIGADYELMLRFLQRYNLRTKYIPNILVKMRCGGISNRNLYQIIKANIECYRAWKKNDLKMSPLTIIRKPFSKISQFVYAKS
ncbi:MAG: glycosyltransferase [Planctomycetes bacterium]|nr:glycosyltransferase [Planctomycetota bacterium]